MVKRTKKTFADIFRAELIKFPTIKEDTNTHVHSKNNLCWLRTKLLKVSQLYPVYPTWNIVV